MHAGVRRLRARLLLLSAASPTRMGSTCSYSAFVDLRSDESVRGGAGQREQPDPGARGRRRVRRVRHLSGLRHPRWRARCVAYYGGWTRCESVPFNVAIGVAVQPRRRRDVRASSAAARCCRISPDEPFVLSGPKIRRFEDLWYLFYIAGRKWKLVDGRRPSPSTRSAWRRRTMASTWTKRSTGPDPTAAWRRTKRKRARTSSTRTAATTCSSATGTASTSAARRTATASVTPCRHGPADWTRDDAQAGIDVSEDGWDSEMISYPHVFELDGQDVSGLSRQSGRPRGLRPGRAGRARCERSRERDALEEARQDLRSDAHRAAERLRGNSRSRRRRWCSTTSCASISRRGSGRATEST